jgi:hypothetical protein
MRFLETHDKGNKKTRFPPRLTGVGKENNLSCAIEKTHDKLKGLPCVPKKCTANYSLPCAFCLSCALYKTHGKELAERPKENTRQRAANKLFAVRPKENARQTQVFP